jgi:hypothetical protein
MLESSSSPAAHAMIEPISLTPDSAAAMSAMSDGPTPTRPRR